MGVVLQIRDGRIRSAPAGAWVAPCLLWLVVLPGVGLGAVELSPIPILALVVTAGVTTRRALRTVRSIEREGNEVVVRGPGLSIRAPRHRCRLEIRQVRRLGGRTLELWGLGELERGERFEVFLLALDDPPGVGQAREISDSLGLRLSDGVR